MLSKELQKKIYSVYVEGQEVRKDPTKEYIKVQKECVEYIASIEFKDERIKMANEVKEYLEKLWTRKQIAFMAGAELERRGLRFIYQEIDPYKGYINYSYDGNEFPCVRVRCFSSAGMNMEIYSEEEWFRISEQINIIYSRDGKKWKVSKTGKLENCLRWLQKVS